MEKRKDDYSPYKDRADHDFVNKLSAILAKQKFIIKRATETTEALETLSNEYIERSKRSRREEDGN